MKNTLIDITGLLGYGLLLAGIYQQFGLASCLMVAGSGLLLFALISAWRKNRVI